MGQKRFKIGELVKYRPLECYGDIWDKAKMPDGKISYIVRLHDNYEKRQFATTCDVTSLEHLSE